MQRQGTDVQLVDYDDEVVYSSDLATLDDGQWLNDTVRDLDSAPSAARPGITSVARFS